MGLEVFCYVRGQWIARATTGKPLPQFTFWESLLNRLELKRKHEEFNIDVFMKYLNNRYGANFVIKEVPDPPDAIIQSNRTIRWVEVATAYWNDNFAKDLHSFAVDKELHMPIDDGYYANPDEQFVDSFIRTITKKLINKSYEASKNKYGKGYLIIPIMYPLFTRNCIKKLEKRLIDSNLRDSGYFRSIYIIFNEFGSYQVYNFLALKSF